MPRWCGRWWCRQSCGCSAIGTGGHPARSETCTTGPDSATSRPNQPPIESWKWLKDYLPGSKSALPVSVVMDNLIVLLLVGLVAGFLASTVMTGAGMGLIWGIAVGGLLAETVVAFIGAVILLFVFRALVGRGAFRRA